MNNTGELKSLRLLWTILAKSHRYHAFVEEDDIRIFELRSEHEGLPFLTIALPSLGKALDKFHATMVWDHPTFFEKSLEGPIGFPIGADKKLYHWLSLPKFLGKAIKLALEGSSQAVECVRQLSYMFYKLEVDYDKALVAETLDRFERTDLELQQAVSDFDAQTSVQSHLAHMRRMISRVLAKADPWDIRPCHGSGATACRTKNKDKWSALRYFPKLDLVYPYADYFFYSMTHLADEYGKLENSAESVPQARIVLVPKDSRGPRVISCEPAELMFIQQGLMRLMYRTIENHNLTKSEIHFTDQTINQSKARQSSIDGLLATLDLKDASDRVSLELVRRVFPSDWVECLEACRSESTQLPSGKIVKLNKFAPMGSACCFPVEALVFWASAQATYRRLGVTAEAAVYGDDIIVPTAYAEDIIKDFVSIGFVVNMDKSFTKGPFRESCGGEYHNGYDVAPVRVRKVLGKSHTLIATGADLCNSIIARFGITDSWSFVAEVQEMVGYVYPWSDVLASCVLFGPVSRNETRFRKRWNSRFQRFEFRVLQLSTLVLSNGEQAWSELLRKELTIAHRGAEAGERPDFSEKISRPLEPGSYADSHAARATWQWTWLG